MAIFQTDQPGGLFHCNSCEQLFEAPMGAREDRICVLCGELVLGSLQNRSLQVQDEADLVSDAVLPEGSGPTGAGLTPEPREVRKQRAARKKRSDSTVQAKRSTTDSAEHMEWTERTRGARKSRLAFYIGVIALWCAAIGLAAWIFSGGEKVSRGEKALTGEEERQMQLLEQQKRQKYVDSQLAACLQTLSGFLSTKNAETRLTYIRHSMRVAPDFVRHYKGIYEVVEPALPLQYVSSKLLDVGKDIAIETTWRDQNGDLLDAVFFRALDGVWKLDWEHFVRASSQSLTQFLTRGEGSIGSFRLLVRERLPASRQERGEFSFNLYEATVLGEWDTSLSTGEAEMRLTGRSAETYLDLVEKIANDEYPFDSELSKRHPKALMEVLVRLRITEVKTDRRVMEIDDFVQGHWFGVIGSGYEEKPRRR